MLSLKETNELIPGKLSGEKIDRPKFIGLSGHSQVSNKCISQLKGIAADNKNKTQYNLVCHTSLFFKFS